MADFSHERYINPYTDFGFKKLFGTEMNTPEERREYEASIKNYWDYFSTVTTAEKKGHAQGLAEGMEKGLAEGMEKGLAEGEAKGEAKTNMKNARLMKAKGYAVEDIAEITGLAAEEIAAL